MNSSQCQQVELDRKTIDEAPALPTPEPKLTPRPEKQAAPMNSPNEQAAKIREAWKATLG